MEQERERPPVRDENTPDSPGDEGKAEQGRPRELGGRKGPDPTRFGDWEKGGRCIDF